MKRVSVKNFPDIGNLIRDDEKYKIYDISFDAWRVSMTKLHPKQSTSGHAHKEALEVYFFVEGNGRVQVGSETEEVGKGDIIMIPKGDFHRVFNDTEKELVFVCVFERYEGR